VPGLIDGHRRRVARDASENIAGAGDNADAAAKEFPIRLYRSRFGPDRPSSRPAGTPIARLLHPYPTEEDVMFTSDARSGRLGAATGARSTLGDALTVLSLVGIVAGAWNVCSKVHRARLAERAALPAERIGPWEAEGGRLPVPRVPADRGGDRRVSLPA